MQECYCIFSELHFIVKTESLFYEFPEFCKFIILILLNSALMFLCNFVIPEF